MRLIKLLTNLLLAVLLALSASTTVSAKVASGSQNLVWTGHQAENVFNWLTCQGKSDRSTTGPPECSVVPKSGYSNLTDEQFLGEVARRAERKVGGTGAVPGTNKHSYAEKLLNRYQRQTGQRGNLATEQSYLNGGQVPRGTAGSARPDVYDPASGAVYDYKFTIKPGRGIPARQQAKNLRNLPHVTSQTEINP